jgi:ATP-dependent Zn protease
MPTGRRTRKRLSWWDRIKFIVLFLVAWLVLFWSTYAEFTPLISVRDAFVRTLHSAAWVLVLLGVEILRQTHFLISEHSAAYHAFWTERVFGGANLRIQKLNPWNRYRVSRVLKILFFLVIVDIVIAALSHTSAFTALFQLPAKLVSALPFAFQMLLYMFLILGQFAMLFWFLSRGGSDVIFPEDVDKRFTDVRGQDAVLEKIKENIIFLEQPELIEAKGGKVPKGILLWGPPGTGKTLMAKAVAGETSKPFIFVEPGAFINMFFGVGILKVKSLFRKARKLSLRYGGVVMFFDEADALGNRGGGVATSWTGPDAASVWAARPACNGLSYLSPAAASLLIREELRAAVADQPERRGDGVIAGLGGMGGGMGGMGTLQSLLGELDGMEKPRGFFNRTVRRTLGMKPKQPPKYRIMVMLATNMPDVLDPALLRPGRIDRIYRVGYPSKEGRIDTYRYYLRKVEHALSDDQIDKLATITPYYAGASIEDLVNASLINAVRDGRDSIEWRDVMKAKQLKELGVPDDVEYIERERHAVAVHEACHAVVAHRVRKTTVIDIATIEKGQSYLGMVTRIPVEDLYTQWRSDFEGDVMSALASLVGERMFFDGDNSSGVTGDLQNATTTTTYMEGYFGMGSHIGSHAVTKSGISRGSGYAVEDGTDRMLLETDLGRRVETRLEALYERTADLLTDNRLEVLAVAHALETHKTLHGEDVAAIIEGTKGPLIDGRPYHESETRDELETYHTQAVVAHKAYGKIDVPLPALVPFIPAVAEVGSSNGETVGAGSPNGETVHPIPPRPDAGGEGSGSDASGEADDAPTSPKPDAPG